MSIRGTLLSKNFAFMLSFRAGIMGVLSTNLGLVFELWEGWLLLDMEGFYRKLEAFQKIDISIHYGIIST